MTPNEFKAWFVGFTEAIGGYPTKAQWARIKDRVAEIDGKPVTERVYVDRYWPTYQRYAVPNSDHYLVYLKASGASNSPQYSCASQGSGSLTSTFNSSLAMAELGRSEGRSFS